MLVVLITNVKLILWKVHSKQMTNMRFCLVTVVITGEVYGDLILGIDMIKITQNSF